MISLDDPIRVLNRVGVSTEPKLNRLGIITVRDLLWYLPVRYQDLRKVTPVSKIAGDEYCTIRVTIEKLSARKTRRRFLHITEANVSDESGTARVVWFGPRFIEKTLGKDDEIFIAGKPRFDLLGAQFVNPIYEKVSADPLHTARIVPMYQLTEGVTNKQLRFLVRTALKSCEPASDTLPLQMRRDEKLVDLNEALREVHLPADQQKLDRAIVRLKFEELFSAQLRAGYSKKLYNSLRSPAITFSESAVLAFVSGLPFKLTGDQRRVAWKLISDMEKKSPMHRLVEGDVGSGKTVVASIAIVNAAAGGYQTALMAPTEILAVQHYRELGRLFRNSKKRISVGLLTSGAAAINEKQTTKTELLKQLAQDGISCIVGTHSLIQEKIKLNNLGLAIIDEQHRFGVEQRKQLTRLSGPGIAPHLVSLTATPIPRTLALALYGELEISTIREKPVGRKPIATKLSSEKDRTRVYEFAAQRVSAGEQVFIMCPLIEESDSLETKSVAAEYERLHKNIFPELEIRPLHGKMKSDVKRKTLEDFKKNAFPILVTTSVIEVGIDIPAATIIIIEGAERFGLAQLHQFRGRVGRSDLQSHCFLFSEAPGEKTRKRLELLTKHQNGFVLAEADLAERGEGELFGTKQSGLADFKIATIHDTELIRKSRAWVDTFLSPQGAGLWNAHMRKIVETAESAHLE